MRSLLLNRWALLCLAIFALALAPFWRNLRDGIPDLLVGAMAGPAELATLALNEDDRIQDALLVPEHQSTGSVMDLQVPASDDLRTRVSLKLRGIDGGGGYPTLRAWMRSADGKLLGTQVFAPGEYVHGSRLTIESSS